jgi:hypothetical protein
MSIYAAFDAGGRCLYVGQTSAPSPARRSPAHSSVEQAVGAPTGFSTDLAYLEESFGLVVDELRRVGALPPLDDDLPIELD